MKNPLGFGFKENKTRFFLMIASAFIFGLTMRVFFIIYRLDYFIDLGPNWTSLSGISLLFYPLGMIFSIFIFKKGINRNVFVSLLSAYIFPLSLLLISKDTNSLFLICCLLALIMGFTILPLMLFGTISKIEYRGRKTGLFCMLIFCFGALLFFISLFTQFFSFILILSISVGILALFFIKSLQEEDKIFNLDDSIEKTNSYQKLFHYLIPVFLIIFIIGLFGTLTFMNYPSYIASFYVSATPPEFLPRIVDYTFSYLFLIMGIGALITGFIADSFGRRNVMILMIILFFIGIFEITSNLLGIPLIVNFLIIASKGICFAIPFFITVLISQDLFQKKKVRSPLGLAMAFFFMIEGIGAAIGGILLPLGNAIIFPLILSSMGLMGVLVLFVAYTKETLPSKEELEWKNAIQDFFCILAEKGICIYRHTFRKEILVINENLFAGGISGIVTMVREMIKSDKSTKVIDQEDVKLLFEGEKNVFCVLISRQNLKILREKLKDIAHEIEVLYEEVFPTWEGNLDIFVPIGSLVTKYFSE